MGVESAKQPSLGRTITTTLLALALIAGVALFYPVIIAIQAYPLFHLVVELAGIVVGTGAFVIVWSTRASVRSGFFLVVGIPSLCIAVVDLLHALTYKGVDMLPVVGANIPTQLWLVGRILQVGALLAATLYAGRRIKAGPVLAIATLATAALLASVYPLRVFPTAFVEGVGLTDFKIVTEYVLCTALVLVIVWLLRRRDLFDRDSLSLLTATVALLIAAELTFTLYTDPFGPLNYVGHVLRLLSSILLYRVLVVNTVTRPLETLYRGASQSQVALHESQERFRATFEQATLGIMHIDTQGRVILANRRMAEISGRDIPTLESLYAEEITEPADRITELELSEALAEGMLGDYRLEKRVARPDGSWVWVNASRSSVRDRTGAVGYFTEIVEDISIRKQAEERLHRSRHLNAALTLIDRAINSTFEIDEIVRRAVAESATALRADSAAVLMRDRDSWVARHTWRFPEEIVGERFSDSDLPHAVEAAATGVPVAIEDTHGDPRVNEAVTARFGIRAVIAIPLAFRGRQLGTLYFNYHGEPHAFDKDDVDFVVKLSSALALAIQNAQLYDAERRTVDAIQGTLLHVANETPGIELATAYHSATELTRIGGDFFDVFMLPEGTIAFIIGDVSGKGLEAAAITVSAKSTLRAFASEWQEPARVMNAANKALSRQLEEGCFITAIYGVFDPASGETRLVCAGHPAPLVCDEVGCVEDWTVRNPPLAVFEDLEFEESRTTLRPGQRMVLFTDGLLDARGSKDFLGEQKVREAIDALADSAPETLAVTLLETAKKHSGGSPPDDIAILAFRYTGPHGA